jgi:hypothetical protein
MMSHPLKIELKHATNFSSLSNLPKEAPRVSLKMMMSRVTLEPTTWQPHLPIIALLKIDILKITARSKKIEKTKNVGNY